MGKREIEELRHPDAWDTDNPQRVGARKSPRVVVSVAFPRPDFEAVMAAAERHRKKVSEFVREAALAATVEGDETKPVLMGTGISKGSIIFSAGSFGAGTMVYGPETFVVYGATSDEYGVVVP